MVDTSKLPISRVDELIDKLNEIDTNLSNLNNNITLINSKLDSMKYITETWSEGTEWYRVWSDGWIEQGGRINTPSKTGQAIIFKKPFSDKNYLILSTGNGSTSSTSVANRRQSMAWVYTNEIGYVLTMSGENVSTTGVQWYACGY